MALVLEPRFGLPNWTVGGDNPSRGQFDAAFAALGNLAQRGEQGPLSQLPPPAAPTTATATVGGTLAPATYGYRITALSGAAGSFAAGETTPSAEVTRVVPAGTNTNTVTLNWVAVPGATGYRIYGRAAGAELLLATVGAVTTWTDTGAGVPAGAMPATNTTAGRPAPGIRNRTYWASDDRGGRYSYDDGANWYDLGPGPVAGPVAGATALLVGHASAATSDTVLLMRGKTGQTGDLLKVQDPTAATDLVRVASSGALFANAGVTVRPASTAGLGLVVNGLTSQTADLQQWQVNGSLVGKIAADGGQTITRPSAGVSQTIATEAASLQGGSLVISRTAAATAQSVSFQAGGAGVYGMSIGRAASSDDLEVGSWNGTSYVKRFSVRPAGPVEVSAGGLDLLNGSPSGYVGGELRFAGAAGEVGISTLVTGAQAMNFDHRGTANTGSFAWRNGSAAANVMMRLSNGAFGALELWQQRTDAFALRVWGSGNTTMPAARFETQATATGDGRYQIDLRHNSYVSGDLMLGQREDGRFSIAYEFGGGVAERAFIDPTGVLAALGTDHYFGPNAIAAGSGNRAHLSIDSANVNLVAEGTSADVGLILKTKGVNPVAIKNAADAVLFKFQTDGAFVISPPSGGPNFLTVTNNFFNQKTTTPAAGGGGALPATPVGYFGIGLNGTTRWVPYYA